MAVSFAEKLKDVCRASPGRVAFPESADPRVLAAAHELLSDGSCSEVTLFGTPDEHLAAAKAQGIQLASHRAKIHWMHDDTSAIQVDLRERLEANAINKGKAFDANLLDRISTEPLSQAGELLFTGRVNAVIAGSIATTADVIRAAISTVGLAHGVRTVSGAFLMVREGEGRDPAYYIFADSGVVIEPTPTQLSDIAASTALTWSQVMKPLTGEEDAHLAFLSFSTKGSAQHAAATKVVEALTLFRGRHPKINADGELQLDAAIDRAIGERKAPGSSVAGRANCLIFPDLNSGNICYKAVQRFGGFQAIGPILQGLAKPYCDLSRGATAEEIAMAARINILRSRQQT